MDDLEHPERAHTGSSACFNLGLLGLGYCHMGESTWGKLVRQHYRTSYFTDKK